MRNMFTSTATAPEVKKCSSWRNQVRATLPPKYGALVDSLSKENEMSASSVVRLAVKQYFDSMPEAQRRGLLHKAQSKHSY